MNKIITCAIAGLGNRGNDVYGNYESVRPDEVKHISDRVGVMYMGHFAACHLFQ